MSQIIKEKPETFDEAVELAKQSSGHTVKLIIPQWQVTIHLDELKKGDSNSKPFTLKGSAISLVDSDDGDLEEGSQEIAELINQGLGKTAKEL